MWAFMKVLPIEVVGSTVLEFLSTKDLVQVETALVYEQERAVLFKIVRAGPTRSTYPLDVPLGAQEQPCSETLLVRCD
jgi:hypothetical protein